MIISHETEFKILNKCLMRVLLFILRRSRKHCVDATDIVGEVRDGMEIT